MHAYIDVSVIPVQVSAYCVINEKIVKMHSDLLYSFKCGIEGENTLSLLKPKTISWEH